MSAVWRHGRPAELVAVGALLAVGIGLRCWRLDLGWFGVDQARDIQTALDIAGGHDWPTIGPTMRRVTSLGALYYYVWALPHLVSDDPLAAYAFAALLGVLTLMAVWIFARRFWGPRAGLVALAVFATSPVAVIDGRVAWAPAALPIVAMTVLWLLVGRLTAARLAALGMVLGLAVQLHLSMVAFGVAAFLVVLARWPGWSALGAAALGFAGTAFPAMYAVLFNAGHDAGIATLPSRGPAPDVVSRLGAAVALGWRVPAALWQWPDAPEIWPLATCAAAVSIAVIAVLGIVRLAVASVRSQRAAAVVLTALTCQVAMVVLLPGEAWYYYLDATLPLVALAAGCCVGFDSEAPELARGQLGALVTGLAITATLILGVHLGLWMATGARHGYLVVRPSALTLDGAGGRDAALPGRLLSLGTKRAIAELLAGEPADFPARWLATHGPAFDDVTGDNGFWLRRSSAPPGANVPPARHAGLWYRDDPSAPSAPVPGFSLDEVGPIVVARYHPTIAYDSCRDEAGTVVVPIRIVPDSRRYGDGTIARATTLPPRIECAVTPGKGGTRVVAAVTSGTVLLRDAAGARSTAGSTSTLCIRRGELPASFAIEVAVPAGAASDLDLYERPDPACAGKIAP